MIFNPVQKLLGSENPDIKNMNEESDLMSRTSQITESTQNVKAKIMEYITLDLLMVVYNEQNKLYLPYEKRGSFRIINILQYQLIS